LVFRSAQWESMNLVPDKLQACFFALGLLLPALAGASESRPCGVVTVGLNTVAADTWFSSAGSNPEGLLADLARQALKEQECKVVLQRMPLARLLMDAEQGHIDVALVLTATPQRLQALRFPETPEGDADTNWALGTSRVSLFTLQAQAAKWQAKRAGPADPGWTVVVQRASVGEELAKAAGWTRTYAPDAERAMGMLRLERADAFIAPEWALSPSALTASPAVVALEPPLRVQGFYAPVSRAFWQREPERAKRLWQDLCRHAGLLGKHAAPCPGLQRKGAGGRPASPR